MTGPPDTADGPGPDGARASFWQRRRDRFVAEIERNRAGDHRVPTWVLAAALFAMIALWGAVVLLS